MSGEDDSYADINHFVATLTLHVACSEAHGSASLGRGGMKLVAEAIEACSRVRNLSIRSDALRSAWPLFERALSKCSECVILAT
jgi:hypothetical protein